MSEASTSSTTNAAGRLNAYRQYERFVQAHKNARVAEALLDERRSAALDYVTRRTAKYKKSLAKAEENQRQHEATVAYNQQQLVDLGAQFERDRDTLAQTLYRSVSALEAIPEPDVGGLDIQLLALQRHINALVKLRDDTGRSQQETGEFYRQSASDLQKQESTAKLSLAEAHTTVEKLREKLEVQRRRTTILNDRTLEKALIVVVERNEPEPIPEQAATMNDRLTDFYLRDFTRAVYLGDGASYTMRPQQGEQSVLLVLTRMNGPGDIEKTLREEERRNELSLALGFQAFFSSYVASFQFRDVPARMKQRFSEVLATAVALAGPSEQAVSVRIVEYATNSFASLLLMQPALGDRLVILFDVLYSLYIIKQRYQLTYNQLDGDHLRYNMVPANQQRARIYESLGPMKAPGRSFQSRYQIELQTGDYTSFARASPVELDELMGVDLTGFIGLCESLQVPLESLGIMNRTDTLFFAELAGMIIARYDEVVVTS